MLAPRLPKSKAQGTEEFSEGHPSAGQTPPVPWAASTGDMALRVRILSLYLQGETRPVWLTSRRCPGSPPAKVLLSPHPHACKDEASQPTFLLKDHFRAQVWAHGPREGRSPSSSWDGSSCPRVPGSVDLGPHAHNLLSLSRMRISGRSLCISPG